jgi:signal transduction histidine kinase
LIPVNVEAIRERLGTASDSVAEMLGRIEDVANQATEFANEIAGFAASRRGEKQVLDLNEVIRSTLAEMQPHRYQAQLTTSLMKQPLICEIYETPFKQIVRNIVLNAFEALLKTKHGMVTVTSMRGGNPGRTGCAIFEFIDNGPGIGTNHLHRIFDSDFSTKPTGNGIGLWLVKKQLELIGGTIQVESSPGAGARFTVRVPLAAPMDESAGT